MRYGAKGPNEATATACTTSAHSIGDSFRIIQHGDADVMIAGGSEAAITPMGVGGFAAMRALSTRNDDPAHACRPLDKDRDGFVIGEGAGILMLEELEHARSRGANILAEIIGYGMSADAYHMTSLAPEDEGCIPRHAQCPTRRQPGTLGAVGLPERARHFDSARRRTGNRSPSRHLFGEQATAALLVSSTKSMTGHLLGGAGGLEAGITIMALQNESFLPPPTSTIRIPPAISTTSPTSRARPPSK